MGPRSPEEKRSEQLEDLRLSVQALKGQLTDIDVPQRTLRDLSNAVKTVEDRVVCLQMPKVESPDRGDEDYSGVDAFLAEKMVADGRWDPADCRGDMCGCLGEG